MRHRSPSAPGGRSRSSASAWVAPASPFDLDVEDFDAILDKVRAGAGAIESELRTEGPRPVAFCSDPFGNGFCVLGQRSR